MKEHDIEAYLVKRVEELGGEIRKVKWIGRRNAPDRVVMLPERYAHPWDGKTIRPGQICYAEPKRWGPRTIWVEVKNPETIKTFPANSHERAQAREHQRMRDAGQTVVVIGTIEQVDEVLR